MESGDALKVSHYMVLTKMEQILQSMQHPVNGLPVESQKNFMTTVQGAFTGSDFLCWLMENLRIEDAAETLHLGNFFCQLGYIYPVAESKSVSLKDDGTLYRFQTPYFWPSLNWQPDHVEYAIYLTKRSLRNKKKYELDEFEQAALSKLQKMLCDKWDFIYMQAQEQVKLLKDRKKTDRLVLASQEKAFWRIQRPVPGQGNNFDVEKQSLKLSHARHIPKKNLETLTKRVVFLENCLKQPRTRFSKVFESLILRCQLYQEHDPFLVLPLPSNPWISDDVAMWELDAGKSIETPTERRVKKWSFCLDELLRDVAGLHEFEMFLEKEFSSENICFFLAVEALKAMPQSKIEARAHEIYKEFLAKGSPREINIDSKTMEATVKNLKKPTRLTFEAAQNHIFLLMKKDSYPRFIRSDQYKTLLALAYNPSKRRKFFNFGIKTRPAAHVSPNVQRRGSAGRAKPSAALDAGPMGSNQHSQHSFSTGNLKELDSDGSDKEAPFRFSPSGIRKQFEEVHASTGSSRDLVHQSQSKQHNVRQDASDKTPLTKSKTVDITVPGRVTPNVVAPWEDETLDITVPGRVTPNVVAPWEDETLDIMVPERVTPNVVTPWEDATLDISVPGRATPNVVAPWEDETLDSVIALSS